MHDITANTQQQAGHLVGKYLTTNHKDYPLLE